MPVFIPKSSGDWFMRKIAFLLSVVFVLLSFSACATKEETTETTASETQSVQEKVENVVVSIKKELVDEAEFLTYISEIEGITSTADDVFYHLEMSQKVYKKLLKLKSQEVIKHYDKTQEENEYIEDIQHSKDFRRVTVLVDREKYDEIDSATQKLQLITLGAYAMSYQMFLTEGQKVYVSAIYSDTQEIAMDVSLPVQI